MLFQELVAQVRGALTVEAKKDVELVAIHVDTFEDGMEYPLLRHTFIGQDEKEARRYIEAHKKADKFFGGCETGKALGKIKCHNVNETVTKMKLSELKKQ